MRFIQIFAQVDADSPLLRAVGSSLHRLRHQAAKQAEFIEQQLKQKQGKGQDKKAGYRPSGEDGCVGGSSRKVSANGGVKGSGDGSTGGKGNHEDEEAEEEEEEGGEEAVEEEGPSKEASFQCPVCLDDAFEGQLCITTRGHTFCSDCIHGLVRKSLGGKCKYVIWDMEATMY